jgi:hypothetical protein
MPAKSNLWRIPIRFRLFGAFHSQGPRATAWRADLDFGRPSGALLWHECGWERGLTRGMFHNHVAIAACPKVRKTRSQRRLRVSMCMVEP